MRISIEGHQLEFVQVPLRFNRNGIVDLFAEKNNRTLTEALSGKRYAKLSEDIRCRYPSSLADRLGQFLYRPAQAEVHGI